MKSRIVAIDPGAKGATVVCTATDDSGVADGTDVWLHSHNHDWQQVVAQTRKSLEPKELLWCVCESQQPRGRGDFKLAADYGFRLGLSGYRDWRVSVTLNPRVQVQRVLVSPKVWQCGLGVSGLGYRKRKKALKAEAESVAWTRLGFPGKVTLDNADALLIAHWALEHLSIN